VDERMTYACGCIERLRHIWFDDNAIEDYREKTTALFEVLSRVAPYDCCHHVHYLWLAYLSAKEECLWYLARYRLALFTTGLWRLAEVAESREQDFFCHK
jgi:hypothetical protein